MCRVKQVKANIARTRKAGTASVGCGFFLQLHVAEVEGEIPSASLV